ncbi:copper homeostasis membrane protein CopD [Pseudomonas sp. MF6784]|jgi:copper resistance protein D|uniref:copper homeostasis membrane protein CopD n=1 Tax=Pseudomonas TaxID=286 RepID=UPI0018E8469D|nr:copper homeostasis membrane protein CopD [Pseudomonas sp. MF6784]MBJ2252702.1 copper homeostasis membrane protein CopD [Pseudomonas sp. MF6784]
MSDLLGIALRFALYLDLMLLFGLGLFALYGLKASERVSGVVLNIRGWLAGTAILGVLLSMASLLVMTRAMSGEQAWQALGPHVQMMLWQTELGLTWILRIGALWFAVLAVMAGAAWPAGSLWLATCAAGVALATLAWAGHGAMSDGALRAWHLMADSAHLLAAGAWFGALAAFGLLLLPGNTQDIAPVRILARALTGFEVVGAVLVAVLIVTGVVNYLLVVGAKLDGIIQSTYGILFSLKLALFGVMLAMAALNRFHLSPLLLRAVETGEQAMACRALRRSLSLEFGAVLLILGLVAGLGTLGPMSSD